MLSADERVGLGSEAFNKFPVSVDPASDFGRDKKIAKA